VLARIESYLRDAISNSFQAFLFPLTPELMKDHEVDEIVMPYDPQDINLHIIRSILKWYNELFKVSVYKNKFFSVEVRIFHR
jgi:hypothetical protein